MMNRLITKLAVPSLVAASIGMSPLALAHSPFDGKSVNVKFEVWGSDDVSSVLGVTNEKDIVASDMTYPDEQDFYVFSENLDHFNWDIDFDRETIELTYTSIEAQDFDHQYMYTSAKGFHFQDTEDGLSDILNVTVNDRFAPFGFNRDLVEFDANNIYVSLKGSMCHIAGMASMPNCADEDSPTGYDNQILLNVLFADTADALFDWLEAEYPGYFPNHQESMPVAGYHARFYPATGLYLGTLNGKLYAYGDAFGGMLDAGEMAMWLDKMPMECPEGQHMMPGGMCMNNSAM